MKNIFKQLFVILSFVLLETGQVWSAYGVAFYIYDGEGHGTISPNSWTTYSAGATVTVTASPDAGYSSALHQCYDDELDDISVTKNGDVYTFTMPSNSNAYIYINFVAQPSRTVKFMVPSCVTSPANNTTVSATVFPTPSPRVIDGYKFEGWVSSSVSPTTTRPATVYAAGAAIPSNGTYYALYSTVSTGFSMCSSLPSSGTDSGKNFILTGSSNANNSKASKNATASGNRIAYEEINTSGNTITCSDWSLIWTFIYDNGYWYIYNNEANKYLAATAKGATSSNPTEYRCTLSDDRNDFSAWTFTSVNNNQYQLTNKKRAEATADANKVYKISSAGYGGFYGTGSLYIFKQGTTTVTYTTSPSCAATTYTVTYAGGSGATGSVTDNNSYEFEDNVTIKGNSSPGFTKTGFSFVGWTCDYRLEMVNSPYTEYLIGETIPAGTVVSMPAASITLTAVWEAKTYKYGSSCEPLENITVTYNDGGDTWEREYGVGTPVTVDSEVGSKGCAEWVFVGWQRGSAVANNSTSYTPVHNFTATAGDDDAVFYAVYEKVNTDWISAFDGSELKSGATYVIVKAQADNNHRALSTTVASTNYLAGTQLATDCETVKDAYDNNRYKLTVTPTADLKWEASYVNSSWRLYNKALGKYIKLSSSDASVALTTACEDAFTITPATHGIYDNDSELHIQSGSNSKYLGWYNSGPYWHGNASSRSLYMITNSNSFTSTPDCGLRTVTFHGNGGLVIPNGGSAGDGVANLGVTETVRDQAITTPTATFADCNGKSWSFVGWSDTEIDVTRVPVLTTDLLHDGGGNKSHTVTASDEEYWAVFTNQGDFETKYGTITFIETDFNGEYTTGTKTKTVGGNNFEFSYARMGMAAGIGIQFEAGTGVIQNTTSLGKVNYISFKGVWGGDENLSKLKIYVGETADAITTEVTSASFQAAGDSLTYYPSANYPYVKIMSASQYVAVESITIGFGMGTKVWATTPDCSTITLTGTPRITSYAGKTVKGVTALTVNAKQLKASTPLSFAAYNVADDTPNSHFGFVGSVSALADGTVTAQTIIVTYTPAGDATTDGIEEVYFKATALADDEVTTTESNKQSGYGRHLPTKFVIATKVGDKWYGMPNNIATTSYGTRALIPIVVNDATSPTTATVYTSTTDYLVWNLDVAGTGTSRYSSMGEDMFFSSPINGNKDIAGDATGLRNSAVAPTNSGYESFAWSPTTTDLGNYTLQNGSSTTYYIATDGSENWTTATTGATVRLLSIDEQPAPDITWYNDMLDANHATNKAENGVVTLPTGENPEACSEAGDLLTFDGWVTTTWDGYKTTGFTKVNNGDAATTNTTYYAVFKSSDKYFTNCPTIQTVTYTANGGTGSDVVESYAMVSSSGTAVTLKDVGTGDGQINFTKEGYVFVGWTTSSNYSSEFKYAGNSVTVKPEDSGNYGNLTLSAVWVGALTITGDVHLTSTYTSSVRSEANTVYTTANPNNLLTVSVAGVPTAIASNLKIRTSYLTSADETQAAATCPFRLCNDGSSNYNIVDGGNLNITSGDYSQTYAIGYKPGVDGGALGTTETYKLKLELINSGGDKVFSTAIKELYGRVLPTHFVIAAKINGQWCALPADLLTSSGTAIQDAYPITVNNDVTAAIAAPKKALYSASVRAHNAHHAGVRLVTAAGDGKDGQLQATRSDNTYLWRTTSDCTTGMQEWYLVSNNFSTYEVRLDPTIKRSSTDTEDGGDGAAYVTRQLCVDGNKILFGTTSAKTMYILPVTNEYEPVEMQVVEWKADGIKFMYFGNPAYTAEVEIEGVNKASAQALGSALQIDHGVYEIAVSDLKGSAYKQMNIIIKNGGTEVGRKAVTIPLMTNSETTVNTARTAAGINKGDCSGVDLVVLGDVLTADDATAHEFNSVTVYGGAKLSVTGKLTAKKMYLRAGSVTATTKGTTPATSYSYVYPQVYVGSGSTLTINENIINFDYLTNYDQYFGVAFPHAAAINKNNITYPDDIYGSAAKTGSYLLRVFDSQIRANQGAVDNVWVDVETGSEAMPKQTNTIRGLGYYALFPPRKVSVNGYDAERQKYGIQRVKMSAESLSNEYADATIDVTAYPAEQPYNAGWWMLGNPYMANLNGGGVGDSNAAILVGKIGKNAQGQYEWQDKEVRYVTVPNDDASETYDQRPVSSYTFPAFKPFYVQVGANGRVTFTTTNRVVAAPSRFFNNEMPTEIETAIALNSEAYGDTTHILINNEFTAEYEVGDDLLKMPHANVSLFTISGTTDLFANALNAQLAAEGIPVGYTAPTEGQYTFSYNDKLSTAWIEHLWLIDYVQNSTTDLLESDYTFNATAETNKTRFVLKIELKSGKEDPTTSIDGLIETSPNEGPIKFIYQDKLYIRYNGIIYDAVGKKVSEIK